MDGHADRPVVAVGSVCRILCAVDARGRSPAREFLDELESQQARGTAALFQRMCDHGAIHNREQFKKVEGRIWEFKKHQIRILCYQSGRDWVLTHGLRKKKDKLPPKEIERANRIMEEDLARS